MTKILIDSFLVESMREYIALLDSGQQIIKRYPDNLVDAYRQHIAELDSFKKWKNGEVERSPEAIRKAKNDNELKAKGGRIIKARLGAKESKIIDALAKEFGSITEAVKHLINNHEQRELF